MGDRKFQKLKCPPMKSLKMNANGIKTTTMSITMSRIMSIPGAAAPIPIESPFQHM